MTETGILKYRKIMKAGHVASRGNQSYGYVANCGMSTGALCNCFSHACFNLSNEEYDQYQIAQRDTYFFYNFFKHKNEPPRVIADRLLGIVRETGLKTEEVRTRKPILKANEWLVSLYFKPQGMEYDLPPDFHFMLLEKDGKWSSKMGWVDNVDIFDVPPEHFLSSYATEFDSPYSLLGFYKITNPNAKGELENELVLSVKDGAKDSKEVELEL